MSGEGAIAVAPASSDTDTEDYLRVCGELHNLRAHHDQRVTALLEANNREVERRRRAEALLRESGSTFRFYETSHRAKVEAAAPESSPADLQRSIDTITKAERNAEIASRIEAHLENPYGL